MNICKKTYSEYLLKNVHTSILPPTPNGRTWITRGDFLYFHYKCEDFDDVGWGCAYRTLQSICSWILRASNSHTEEDKVPSIPEIQQTLVSISDKPQSFFGSHEWIGALEVFYVIDALYDVPCKILHISQSEDVKKYANIVKQYFEDFGGFIMMGGDIDAASKGIAGIHISGNQAYFLVIDPHFIGRAKGAQDLIDNGLVRWQHTSEFIDSSFYNLCLPQVKAKKVFENH